MTENPYWDAITKTIRHLEEQKEYIEVALRSLREEQAQMARDMLKKLQSNPEQQNKEIDNE